jgi:hypothetical protein
MASPATIGRLPRCSTGLRRLSILAEVVIVADEPRFIILERHGGYILAWKSNVRRPDTGEPLYVYDDERSVLYPTREAAQAGMDKYLQRLSRHISEK